jgi:hypothetical protein
LEECLGDLASTEDTKRFTDENCVYSYLAVMLVTFGCDIILVNPAEA